MSREADNQPNIEEVLASIRRLLAEGAGEARAADGPPPVLPTLSFPPIDETEAFALPAIFRPDPAEPGAPEGFAAQGEHPRGGVEDRGFEHVPDADIPRAMPLIKDRLIARMGQSEPAASAVPDPAPSPDRRHEIGERPAIPKANLGAVNFLLGEGAAQSKEDTAGEPAEEPLAPPPGRDPVSFPPDPASVQSAPHRIDDTMASLLRPLLRQWLDDNMKRVVARALHIEADEKK